MPVPARVVTIKEFNGLSLGEKLAIFEQRAELFKDAPDATKKIFFVKYISSFNKVQLDLIKNWGEHLAFHGCFELLKLSLQFNPDFKLDNKACDNAAKMGHLEIVELCGEHGCLDNIRTNASACVNAAKGGHLKIIKFLRTKNPHFPWCTDIICKAVEGGHIEFVRWCIKHGCPRPLDDYDQYMCCSNAASRGDHDLLKLLRDQGYRWDYRTLTSAVYGNQNDIVGWCINDSDTHGDDSNQAKCCSYAATEGNYKILKLLKDHGFLWKWDVFDCDCDWDWENYDQILCR